MNQILKVTLLTLLFAQPTPDLSAHVEQPQKHVIGCVGVGLFSMFFMALNHLSWCVRNNRVPVVYWDYASPYYQPDGFNGKTNAWEYYFEPVSPLSYESGDPIDRNFLAPDGSTIDVNIFLCNVHRDIQSHYCDILKKYVKIRSCVQQKIDAFYSKHFAGKKTVGIHLRGTDKHLEVKQVPVETIIEEANKCDCDQYFVATDEQKLLDKAISMLKKPVVYYDSIKSTDGAPIHLANDSDKAVLGEQVLIETLLLCKCTKFIHTCSNVSTAVHFFNPQIDCVLLKVS